MRDRFANSLAHLLAEGGAVYELSVGALAADGGWYSDEYGREQADFLLALRGGVEANQLEVSFRRARFIVALRGRAAAMDAGMPLDFSPDDSTWVVEGRTVRITLGRRLG